MPLYELLCLARPRLPREDMSRMISRVGSAVFDKGGVITELKSFAEQPLAYPIRKTHGKYEEAHIWQMNFMLDPVSLKAVNHELRINENIIRWAVVKRPDVPPMPNSARLFWTDPKYGAELRPPSRFKMPWVAPTATGAAGEASSAK